MKTDFRLINPFVWLKARGHVPTIVFLTLARLTAVAATENHAAAGPDVVIVRDSHAVLPIVRRARDNIAGSVDRLQHKLERISGAVLDIVGPEHEGPGLHVGVFGDFPGIDLEIPGEPGAERFVIHTTGDSLYILADTPLGVDRGVTTFLHKLGCRWFFPGDVWEVIPAMKTISGRWSETSRPDFHIYRRIWYGFGTHGPCRRDLDHWITRNRMGGPTPVGLSHSWYGLDREQDFASNPEWFAEVGGERRNSKPCYSHPKVIRRMIESARRQAEAGRKMVGVGAPDGLGYCECAQCRRVFQGGEPFEAHRTLFATRPDGVLVNITSETLFAATDEVARVMAAEYPDVMVTQFAYSAYAHPPSFRMEPNVYIQTTTGFRRTPLSLEEQLEAWGERASNIGIYDYWGVFMWDWDSPNICARLHFDGIRERFSLFARNNITAMNAESSNHWGPRGLGYYVASVLLWDTQADLAAIVADFYRKAFGPAALPMQRHYARWYGRNAIVLEDKAHDDPETGIYSRGDLKGTRESLRAMFADLSEAATRVAELPEYRERVDHIRMYAYYLYLRFHEFKATAEGDEAAILAAIEAETRFGGRLAHTNLIHTRALIDLAFERRFRRHRNLLEAAGVPTGRGQSGGFRQLVGTGFYGDPPDHDELNRLWEDARETLGR